MPSSRASRLFASLAVLAVSAILLAGLVVYVLVALLAALAGEGTVLGTLLDLAFPVLAAGVVLTILVAVSGLGVAWAAARTAADFGAGRFARAVAHLERRESDLDGLLAGVDWDEWMPERAEGSSAESEADALADLRERYAAGELGDEAFERELERILGGESSGAGGGPSDDGRTGAGTPATDAADRVTEGPGEDRAREARPGDHG